MRHVTISTTGVFNTIRSSLFPPIEGKEMGKPFEACRNAFLFSLPKTN